MKKIIFGEGITEIKDYAFGWDEKWKSLVEIQFPNTLTRIGDRAFEAIPSLKKINIPDNIVSIGDYAFEGTDVSGDITLPSKLEEFYPSVFRYCQNIKNIYVNEGNKNYVSVDGVLLKSDKSTIVAYPNGKLDTTYYIPEGVKEVDCDAFCGSCNLKEVIFPNSVSKVTNPFYWCTELENLVIPKSVTEFTDFEVRINSYYNPNFKNIYCQSESLAEEYAKTNNIPYVIDDDVPVINGVVQDGKFITINAQDEIVGLHRDAYSLDGVTWSSSNKLEIESEKEYTIYVRDKLGNIATIDFKSDKFEEETEQKEESKTSETEGQSKDETSTTAENSNDDETVAKEKLGSYGDKKVGIIIAVIGCFAIYKYRRFKSVQ